MDDPTRLQRQLNYAGAAVMIEAALAKARAIAVPQNIVVVDAGGNMLACARMDGARFLALHSALSKAQSAASLAMPSGQLPEIFGINLALATGNRSINLPGGLPVLLEGQVIGAIGVSSGADAEDVAVAEAGRAALLTLLADRKDPPA